MYKKYFFLFFLFLFTFCTHSILMKFAKQLETESENIPLEWRPYLIQYKALKKLINKVTQEIESRGLSVSLLQNDKNIKYYFTGKHLHRN